MGRPRRFEIFKHRGPASGRIICTGSDDCPLCRDGEPLKADIMVVDYPDQIGYVKLPDTVTRRMFREILADLYFMRHASMIEQEPIIWPMQLPSRGKGK